LPARGQVFEVAELTLSPGEASGEVPVQANGPDAAVTDRPVLEVNAAGATSGTVITAPTYATRGILQAGSLTIAVATPLGSKPVLSVTDKGLTQQVSLASGRLVPGPAVLSRAGADEPLSARGVVAGATVSVSDAALVWFAGSDGGTVPPNEDEAYLQVLATTSPSDANITASNFTLDVPGGEVLLAQALPDSDRQAIVVGFLVPASFSDGTVVVSAAGRSFDVSVRFA
jgi:hypothetical protein